MTCYLKADCFYYPTEVKPAGYLSLHDGGFWGVDRNCSGRCANH
ncbi:N-acetylglucosamine-6-phosphate deacetylase [Streptococcus pyogenes]|nr:N-acetylglucosamine-6-phosphate deacetylase [Streptococcus pyogenes]